MILVELDATDSLKGLGSLSGMSNCGEISLRSTFFYFVRDFDFLGFDFSRWGLALVELEA
jgi:hypothetical protein